MSALSGYRRYQVALAFMKTHDAARSKKVAAFGSFAKTVGVAIRRADDRAKFALLARER